MACAGWPEAAGRPGRWLAGVLLFVCHGSIRNFVLFILGISMFFTDGSPAARLGRAAGVRGHEGVGTQGRVGNVSHRDF